MNIRELQSYEQPPMDLLLLADPSVQKVGTYLETGSCFVGEVADKVVAVFVLLPMDNMTMELMNIAVSPQIQGKGYGKQMLNHAIHESKNLGYLKLVVGTGNSSIDQLALYQKCGFRITGVERDFFLKNYPSKIVENGIWCRDKIELTLELEPIV